MNGKWARTACLLYVAVAFSIASVMAQQATEDDSGQQGRQRARGASTDNGGRQRTTRQRANRDRTSRTQSSNGSGQTQSSSRQQDRTRTVRNGPPSFSAEDRERFYNHMVDRYVDRATRSYELSDEQKQQVRAQLEQVKQAQRAYSEPRSAEIQSLFSQMHQFHETERAGGQVDPAERQAVENRLRTMREESPLMNSDRVVKEIERVLPSDQVERGHSKWEAEHRESERRREEMRLRSQQSHNQASGAQGADGNPAPAGGGSEATGSSASSGGQHRLPAAGRADGGRDRNGHGGREGRHSRGSRSDRNAGDGEQVGEVSASESEEQRLQRSERPIGEWEQYLRNFIRTYQLDAAQQGTAASVLREVQERRTSYELSHRTDYETAGKQTGSRTLDELNKPIVAMFEELKMRLLRIPSSAQRQVAGYKPPPPPVTATQPVAASSQPG